MKAKITVWISALLLLMVGMMGCEKAGKVVMDDDNHLQQQDQPNANQPEEATEIPTELIGSWKLAGFVNTADNTLREAEPKECEKCYTITFLSDGTITGHTSTNEITGEYWIKGRSFEFLKLGGTKINELFDGQKYVEALHQVDRFEIVSQKLKLYYNGGKNYLRFKKVVGTTDDSMDNEIEILLDGKKTVKGKKINGLVLKFCLLNKQARPDTVFKEGENFTFYFSLKNITQDDISVSADFINNDFYRVYQSDNTDRGTPWTGTWCEFRRKPTEIKITPLTTRKLSCPWKLTYDTRPDYPFCMSESRETLPKGDYYTTIHTKFKYVTHKEQLIENLHFKINFKIR